MSKLMINHMVLRNQEYAEALQNFICNFDIYQIDGQNVSIAVPQIKAVITALEPFRLPTNAP